MELSKCYLVFRSILPVILFGSVISALHAQQPGRWAGVTSQERIIQFTISSENTIEDYFVGLIETCPSGVESSSAFGTLSRIPIVDASFTSELPPADGNALAITFAGDFTNETEANGTINWQAPRFRVEGKQVDSQICEANITWEANWQSPAGLAPHSHHDDQEQQGLLK